MASEKLKATFSVSILSFLAGIAGYRLLGPYFLPPREGGAFYYDFLPEPLQDTTLHTRINPYPTAFPYGNGMVLHFYQQQESSTTKTVHKVINKGLKAYV